MKCVSFVFFFLLTVAIPSSTAVHLSLRRGGGDGNEKQVGMDQEAGLAKEEVVRKLVRDGGRNGYRLREVPLDIHRLAAQHLVDAVEEGSAPGWNEAMFVDDVRTLLRPDVDGAAYYEFRVERTDGPAGFVVVSSGGHDFPIAHWSSQGLSPTEYLMENIEDGPIKTFYKVDTLCYVGENSQGAITALLGELPQDVEGWEYDETIYSYDSSIGANIATEDSDYTSSAEEEDAEEDTRTTDEEEDTAAAPAAGDNDDHGNQGNGNSYGRNQDGSTSPGRPAGVGINFVDSGGNGRGRPEWSRKKQRFLDMYETPIQALQNAASDGWETELLARTYGEGLVKDEPFYLALLFPLDTFSATITNEEDDTTLEDGDCTAPSGTMSLLCGPVMFERIAVTEDRELLQITATENLQEATLVVNVDLDYTNGLAESKQFLILSQQLLDSGVGAGSRYLSYTVGDSSQAGRKLAWSSWSTYSTDGGDAAQRKYHQIVGRDHPNYTGCMSGCGPTAWAMLFGWADYMASIPNSGWNHRWGIYRYMGGTGSNVVAPLEQDLGVEYMTMEIHLDVGTYCTPGANIYGSAATNPWSMISAGDYLRTRTGATVTANWSLFTTDGLFQEAKDTIRFDDTPVIIGTGWLTHYPLAFGYRYRTRVVRRCFLWECWDERQYEHQFRVNNGWGSGATDTWVPGSTWFVGRIHAN